MPVSNADRQAAWRDIARLIREFAPPKPTDRILDAACGDGGLTVELAQLCAYASGIDLSEDMIAAAMERMISSGLDNLSFQVGDVSRMEFPDGSFDMVFCRLALHHFPDPAQALREMRRVLKSPGRLILADIVASEDPARREAHNRIEKSRDPSHQAMLSPRQLREIVKEAGFSIEQEQTWSTRRGFEDWIKRVGPTKGAAERTRRLLKEAATRKSTDLDIAVRGKAIEFTHRLLGVDAIKLG